VSADEDTRVSPADEDTHPSDRSAPILPLPADVDLERTRMSGRAEGADEHTELRGRRIGTAAPTVSTGTTGVYRAPSVEPGSRVSYGVSDKSMPVAVTRVRLDAPTERSTLAATPSELREAARQRARRRMIALVVGLLVSVIAVVGGVIVAVMLLSSGSGAPLP
jgi:hypothetical protein